MMTKPLDELTLREIKKLIATKEGAIKRSLISDPSLYSQEEMESRRPLAREQTNTLKKELASLQKNAFEVLSPKVTGILEELNKAEKLLIENKSQSQLKADVYGLVTSLKKDLTIPPSDKADKDKLKEYIDAIEKFSKNLIHNNHGKLQRYFPPASTFMQKLKAFFTFSKPNPNIQKMENITSKHLQETTKPRNNRP